MSRQRGGRKTFAKKKTNNTMHQIARTETRKALRRSVETKMYDGVIDDQETDYAGAVYSMTANNSGASTIVQSITDFGYIGNKIQPFMLMIRLALNNTGTEDTSFNKMRILVVQVKGGGVPSAANVLASVGNDRTPLSAYDRNYKDTYRVLYDKMSVLNYDSISCSIHKIKLKGLFAPVSFSDTTGTVQANGIYLIIYADEAALASAPSLNAYHRLYYKDA